jgi:hypothetical protein
VIVHTRDADDDTIAILRDEMGKGPFTGLIHCFTGTRKLADAALEMGLSISVSGIATFKNSQPLRDVIKSVPLERLLVETDAPFLAPVPHRGKPNEPAFVVHTATMLAELKGVTGEELARAQIVAGGELPADVITMNTRVLLRVDGAEEEVSLVFPNEADVAQNRISVLSPIGTAILGYRTGDTFEWRGLKFEVLDMDEHRVDKLLVFGKPAPSRQ